MMDIYEEKIRKQTEIKRLLKNKEPLAGEALELVLSITEFDGNEDICKLYRDIGVKLKAGQLLTAYEIYLMEDRVMSMDFDERKKERKSRGASYGHVKRRLLRNEPLAGKTLELALELVDVNGDDEFSRFLKNIGVKMKDGKSLSEYELHIMVDMILPQARLGV